MYRKEVLMYFLAVDYSKRFSVLTLVDNKGGVVQKGRLVNTREAFENFVGKRSKIKAVIEAGRNCYVAAELLEGLVDEIKLAHPLKVRAIAEAKIKTDEIDSEILVQLLRADLIPEAYLRSAELREKQSILRLRSFWIRQRTAIRNRIHALVDGQREEIREEAKRFSDLFGKKGRKWLDELHLESVSGKAINGLLEIDNALSAKIKESDQDVKQLYESDEDCRRIDSIPGFGIFLSTLAKVEIGEMSRFKSASHLASYAGVIPSTYSSGGKTRHGKITKQGNKFLRWCLVEAAIHSGKECPQLKKFYLRMKRRKGTKLARVAVARKLCLILFRVLSEKDKFRIYKTTNMRSRLQLVTSVPT
jgi:transposase